MGARGIAVTLGMLALTACGARSELLSLSTIVDVSCSHVYVRAYSPMHADTFVRIPLSQLGPGNPP